MQPTIQKWVSILLLIAMGSFGGGGTRAVAQDEAAAQPQSATTEGAATPASTPLERLIYVPYRNLKAVFGDEGATAFLPYGEYLKLVESMLGDRLRQPIQPPVAGVITSAKYVGTVEADLLRVTATLQVQAFNKGWAEIPVRFGEAAIGNITSDSGQVLLRGTGTGTYALLIPTAGEHAVTLELTARVRTSPDGRSVEFQVPPVGITTVELSIPEPDQAIELQPQLVTESIPATPQETRIKANVGATEKIAARWHPQVGSKPEMQLLANATTATLVTVEDGLVHTDSWLMFDVLRGDMEQARVVVPKGQRVLDVSSDAKVKTWTSVEEADRQILTVEFLSRLTGRTTVEVHLERELPVDPFEVAGLNGDVAFGVHALDVVRESGQIALRSGNDVSLTIEQQQGVQRLDESEVDSKIRRPGAIYLKYYNPAIRLLLQARPVQPRILMEHLTQVLISEDRLRTNDQFDVTIDRAGVFELRFRIPEGITIENVDCEQMKQFDLSADKQTLTLSLREKILGSLTVEITGLRTAEFAVLAAEQPLPVIEPSGVEVETGNLHVFATEAIEVVTESGKVVSAQVDPNPDDDDLEDYRLVSAWTYNRRPVTIPVRLLQKPTRLTAKIGSILDVKQGQVQVRAKLTYLVEYAGLDTFRFSVPEAIADAVQIVASPDGVPIKQKNRAEEAEEGWVAWTVVMQRDVTGEQEFTVTYDLTPTIDESSHAEVTSAALPRILPPYSDAAAAGNRQQVAVSRITGEVTVIKDRALSVKASPKNDQVETIDVRELTQLEQDGFTAFRYFEQPVTINLTAEKMVIEGVIDVVVSRALVEVVLDRSGTATYRARYRLKTSERQRLPLKLPVGAEPLGVNVDRKSVELEKDARPVDEKGWDPYFINVARTSSADEPFSLAVMFRLNLDPPPFTNYSGPLMLRLPMLGSSTTDQEIAVQQLRVAVWVPEEYSLVGTPAKFTLETRPPLRRFFVGRREPSSPNDLEQWVGSEAAGVFDFPTEGRVHVYSSLGNQKEITTQWWHLPFYTWVVSGALVVIAIVLRKTSCENKLTIVFVTAFLAAAYALSDQDVIRHGLAVSAYGLIAVVALWIVHEFVGKKTMASSIPMPPEPPPEVPQPPASDSGMTATPG